MQNVKCIASSLYVIGTYDFWWLFFVSLEVLMADGFLASSQDIERPRHPKFIEEIEQCIVENGC
ncbi:MAG: hypothetical protein V7711_18420 [Pseudomonadales bacterium]